MKICLTGGGTAGHVMPHLAIYPELKLRGWQVFYIGSFNGIERSLATKEGISYFGISTGKLRRYWSFENFRDVFLILSGIFEAFFILLREKPDLLFSKGGFVSVPVAYAAFVLRIPVISHESDVSPGLATRLIKPIATKMMYAFEQNSTSSDPKASSVVVGLPVRRELSSGSVEKGWKICQWEADLSPVVLVMGGSLGAASLNLAMQKCFDELTSKFRVIHICGKAKVNKKLLNSQRYVQFEFLQSELKDVLALASIVVSRAGATAIFEFLSVKKPMLLVPLLKGSRGDQLLNAKYFSKRGWAQVLDDFDLEKNPRQIVKKLEELSQGRTIMLDAQSKAKDEWTGIEKTLAVIQTFGRKISP